MIKQVVLAVALIVGATAASITHKIETIRNGQTLGMPGKPDLPSVDLTFLLPANTDLSTVVATVTGDTSYNTKSFPVGEPFLVNGEEYWSGVTTLLDGKDQTVYAQNTYFPAGHVASISTGKMRDYCLVTVTITPESYNPVTGTAELLENATVHIDYKVAQKRKAPAAVPASFVTQVQSVTQNFDQFKGTYSGVSRAKSTYAIITSSSIKNSLSSLSEFTRVKHAKGYNVKIYTENTWGGGDGETAAIRIREWLQENYEAEKIEYILFIGNPSEGAVPMKFCYPDFSGRYKCYVDYFYGDLSGDWDITKDGKYGMWKLGSTGDNQPGGCDQYAEVYVGRIPYYGSISETEAILQKLIKYETATASSVGWRNNVYLPLNAFESMDGSQLGGAMCSKIFTPAGNNVTKLYDRQCSIDGVIQKWNSGQYGIVTWQGHGLADYTEGVMYSHRTPELSDAYPAHVYQISCHNGKPQQSNNLGYAILKNAAISTVSASVQVLYSASMKPLGTSSTARHWAYMYDKGLVLDSLSSGESMAQAKATLKITFDSDWLNAFEMNLYGCPEIGLYSYGVIPTSIKHSSISVATNANITFRNNSLFFDEPSSGFLNVYSALGKVVYEKKINSALSVSLRGLAKGIYFVQFRGSSGAAFKKRISIQ